MFETVRAFRALMDDEAQAPTLIADMQARVALLFDAWAVAMVRDGRRDELCDLLSARVDAANAERVVERIEALAAAGKAPPARGSGRDSDGPSQQGSLFC